MNLYRDENGQWTGTQADAKQTGAPWALVEVPTDKWGLISWLNNMERELRATIPAPTPPPPPSPKEIAVVETYSTADNLVDEILNCNADKFGTYLNATIDRLGELRNQGFDALAVLRKQVRSFPNRTTTERGLGYFLLGDVE